jgi:DHA1 family bicyclomycin/chloramphenicol resistance-like MFS transporter
MLKFRDFIFCVIAAAGVSLGYATIDIYLPALPILKHAFATTTLGIQSTLTIFLIGTMLSYFIMGPLADYLGFRKLLLPLYIVLIAGSIICALASNLWVLSTGRFIQALAAGGLGVIGRGSFMKYFSEEKAMQLFVSVIPAVATLSPALAPTVGGFLVHHFIWQSIFIFLCCITALLFILALKFYHLPPETNNNQSIHPIAIAKNYGKLLSNQSFLLKLTTPFLLFLIYMAFAAEMPFIMHHAHYNPHQIGLSFIPLAVSFFINAQIASRLSTIWSKTAIVSMGFALMLTGFALLFILTLTVHNIIASLILPTYLYLGAMGFINPVVMGQCVAMFPNNTGYAASVTGAVTMLGSILGSATVNTVTHGSQLYLACYMCGLLCLAVVFFVFSLRKTWGV